VLRECYELPVALQWGPSLEKTFRVAYPCVEAFGACPRLTPRPPPPKCLTAGEARCSGAPLRGTLDAAAAADPSV
jgi:hypothetical protein